MSTWTDVTIGSEIELAYGKSLPEHARKDGVYDVFGSNGRIGRHSANLVRGPGIIVGRKGSVGEVVYSERDFWPIDTTYYVVKKREHDWRFLFHLLSSLDLGKLNSHSAVPGLNREDVYSIAISLPELSEQKQIAAVLDVVDTALTLEGDAIVRTRIFKRAAMQALFTRGLRGEAQKDTEIGSMPESWRARPIQELSEIWSGGTPRKSIADYWNGDIPWVSGKDLKTPWLDDSIDHISQQGVQSGSRLAPSGAVLILVRGMGLAKDLPIAVINRPMAFNQDVKALVSRGEFRGEFLRSAIYVGKDRLLSRIVPSAHGTMTLNLDDIETFQVACPRDPTEADEIVAILNAIDRKTDLHSRKRAVLDELFKALLHKLMTGEIRVADLDFTALTATPSAEAAA